MKIKPIKCEQDYERTLARIGQLIDAKVDTPEGDELDVLVTLAEAWDNHQGQQVKAPVTAAQWLCVDFDDPVKAIADVMQRQGLSNQDLIPYIGHSGRVSEILHYKRHLTLPMIRKLHRGLGISTDILVQAYELKSRISTS